MDCPKMLGGTLVEWISLHSIIVHHINKIIETDETAMVGEEAETRTSKRSRILPHSLYVEMSLRIRDRWQSKALNQSRHEHSVAN